MIKYYNKLMLEFSKILMTAFNEQDFVEKLNTLFKEFIGINNINFFVLDYNTGMFRDFVRDWIYIENKEQQKAAFDIFNTFEKNTDNFILNGKEFSLTSEETKIEEIEKNGSFDVNYMYLPLYSPDRVFGFIEVQYQNINQEIVIDKEFFHFIQILIVNISNSINNQIIKKHMAEGLNFYDAMKNIAKIIENQYELEYIIPQIGEMIDRFISSHLIYIFLKEDEKYKLIWPSNCNNTEIINMIENNEQDDTIKISKDNRIGIFPIKGEGDKLGVLVAYSTIGKLSTADIEYLVELTKQSGITIQRANVYSEVLKHATMDALTGLNNRRQFEIRLRQETSQSIRKNTDLCCIMLDIDFFKKVNDTYGHAAGDCVLKGVAEIITKTIREYDIACRYGGEEFFILLPMTKISEAYAVAQRLRANIESTKIDIRDAKVKGIPYLQVTGSIGVNEFHHEQTPEDFYQCADKALYSSKINGRNRVTLYSEELENKTDKE
ncbi:GGDEF domain-containing protein [bacterium]|nr:GGDEF domain-containing protein [bacterium]